MEKRNPIKVQSTIKGVAYKSAPTEDIVEYISKKYKYNIISRDRTTVLRIFRYLEARSQIDKLFVKDKKFIPRDSLELSDEDYSDLVALFEVRTDRDKKETTMLIYNVIKSVIVELQRKPKPPVIENIYTGFETYSKYIEKKFSKYKLLETDDLEPTTVGKFEPKKYQRFIRNYLSPGSKKRGLLIYHGLGSGKTCTSILTSVQYKKPIIVLLPAALKNNFRSEVTKCGSNYDQFYYISYNAAGFMKKIRSKFGNSPFKDKFVIIDEIHNMSLAIANKKSLERSVPKSTEDLELPDMLDFYESITSEINCNVIGLTGTPLINDPYELSILFNIIQPRVVSDDYRLFNTQFVDRINNKMLNSSQFFSSVAGYVSYYVGKKQDSKDFPTTKINMVNVELCKDETYNYLWKRIPEMFYEETHKQYTDAYGKKKLIPTSLTFEKFMLELGVNESQLGYLGIEQGKRVVGAGFRMASKYACNHYEYTKPGASRSSLKSSKLKYIYSVVSSGQKCFIYSFFKGTCALIQSYIKAGGSKKGPSINSELWNSDIDEAGRKDILDRYNNPKDPLNVIIATSAGTEGISLMETRHVIIVEPYWNITRINQIIGRAVRLYSHSSLPKEERNVEVHILVAKINKEITIAPSEYTKKESVTSDEHTLAVANKKEELNSQFTDALKASAIDCYLNYAHNKVECAKEYK